ncbi:helix-turn-helix domain-containing protein [Butyricicoccus sp.]|uniref:helix-turn-helix domain-containing protein n=1 Tax=Butyricicoccus sp. TaxID=2049021 RepID=UPI003F139D29
MNWLENLRIMKKQSGLTTAQIAEKSQIPEPTLEKLFSGATKDPKLKTMSELVHSLGFTLDDLAGTRVLGKTKATAPEKTEADARLQEIVNCYHTLNEQGKNFLLMQTRIMAQSKEFVGEDAESKNA